MEYDLWKVILLGRQRYHLNCMCVCVCVYSGSLAGQTSGSSSLSPVTSLALSGLTGSPLNTMASINGLGSTGLTHNGTGLDALTSAYPGIQQYAGMVRL
jgi:hypothetical protein